MGQYALNEVFDIAKQIERNGYKFYEHAMTICKEQQQKDFFAHLRDEETKHLKIFEALQEKFATPESEASWDGDDLQHKYLAAIASSHVFNMNKDTADYLKDVKTVIDALLLALRFEKDTILYFTHLKECVTGNSNKEAVQKLIDEEKQHVIRLAAKLKEIQSN